MINLPLAFNYQNTPLAINRVVMEGETVFFHFQNEQKLPSFTVNDETEMLGAIFVADSLNRKESILGEIRLNFLQEKYTSLSICFIDPNGQVFYQSSWNNEELLQAFLKMCPVIEINLFILGKLEYINIHVANFSSIEELNNCYDFSKLNEFNTVIDRKTNGKIEVQTYKTSSTIYMDPDSAKISKHFEQNIFAQTINALMTKFVVKLIADQQLASFNNLKSIIEKAHNFSLKLILNDFY